MGFSIQQARVALAATDSGLDVQAALETLLSNGAGAESRPTSAQSRRPREREPPQFRDIGDSGPEDANPPPQRIHPRRDRLREPPSRDSENQKNIQDQANELLAQASTIGLSMFNRANALWKEGREKVQKAYEERAAVQVSSSSSSLGSKQRPERKDTRPKWMQDGSAGDTDEWRGEPSSLGGFRDDLDDTVLPPHPSEQQDNRRPHDANPTTQSPARDAASSRPIADDLLGVDSPKVYVSPFRRKTPSRSQAPPPPLENRPTQSRASPAPARTQPLVQRKCVSASATEISTSAKHKATGTEMFKLGRYAEAETAYSYAIAALPDSHLLLVPLYNNRALTRIKTGDHTGAVDDCTRVLKLIGATYHPSREAKVTREDEGASVDLADAYVKALRRRAEAYEGREKWEAAKSDWETITSIDFAGKTRSDAVQAASRCRRMLSMNADGASSSRASPAITQAKPKPKPAPSRPAPPSQAASRVREANMAAEAEDQEKHALKDSVDAKLLAWKGGKEANLRALIASLDTVLWPELGLAKSGMHELVTPAQVKIRYTKAIAKLHPDKVGACRWFHASFVETNLCDDS
jgi:tetratricopeptide (TPR) repeat protein